MKALIFANWKANKTIAEATSWVEEVKDEISDMTNVQIVICSSFVVLPILKKILDNSNIRIGAQNVSRFENGAYTGEVTAEMLKGLTDFCIVGHSERQKYFGENKEEVSKKVENLLKNEITPVLCIADENQLEEYLELRPNLAEQAERIVFVYEPPRAISGGGDYHPETPELASKKCKIFKERLGAEASVIYGGSVNPENIGEFLKHPEIQGVLPGQASLEAETFVRLVGLANEAVL
jgi:triosephosphate isomerase